MSYDPASPVPFRRFRLWLALPVCLFVCALPAGLSAQTVAFTGVLRTLGSGYSDPAGVAVYGSGNVYVADGGRCVVHIEQLLVEASFYLRRILPDANAMPAKIVEKDQMRCTLRKSV